MLDTHPEANLDHGDAFTVECGSIKLQVHKGKSLIKKGLFNEAYATFLQVLECDASALLKPQHVHRMSAAEWDTFQKTVESAKMEANAA